jgi:phosphate starvation-inducible PhoH-like protein
MLRNHNKILENKELPDKDKSPKIFQREKVRDALNIRALKFTPKQQELINLILDKKSKIIFIDGPAGTTKTYLSIYCALTLINQKRMSDIIFVRSIIESASKGLGSLPGESSDKFKPFLLPLEDKLNELLSKSDIDFLFKDQRIHPIPINFLRGASYNAKVVIGEETQNFTFKELTTLITRLGEFSKMILIGDSRQSDLNGKSGFKPMFDIFDNEESRNEGIYTFSFTVDDVLRSGVLKFILKKLDTYNSLRTV